MEKNQMIIAVVAVVLVLVVAGAGVMVLNKGDNNNDDNGNEAGKVEITIESGSTITSDTISSSADSEVVITVDTDSKEISQTADASAVKKLIENKNALTISTKSGTSIVLDKDTVAKLDGEKPLAVEITSTTEGINEDLKTAGANAVISINVTNGAEVKTLAGKATITVPYELKAGEDAKKLKVWYQTTDSEGYVYYEQFDATYDSSAKTLSFTTTHFSDYFVADKTLNEAGLFEKFTITTYIDYNGNMSDVTFTHVPERLVAGCNTALNLFLYLGLGEKIVGCYYIEEEVWEEVAGEYEALKTRIGEDHILPGNITTEALTAWNPDLVIGWVAWTDGKLGSESYFNDFGCNVMSFNTMVSDSTLDGMKSDYDNIGKIFNMTEKTDAYMAEFDAKFKQVEGALSEYGETIAIFDGFGADNVEGLKGNATFYKNTTFIGYLLEHMGASLYTGKVQIDKLYLECDQIDLLFFVCYGDATFDKTLKIWTSDDVLKTTPAIVNDKYAAMKLSVAYGADPSLIDVLDSLLELLPPGEKAYIEAMKTAELPVLGNINGDKTIDQKDVEAITALVGTDASIWRNLLADANADGVIDSADVEIVEKIVAGQTVEVCHMEYYDANGDGVMDYLFATSTFPFKNILMTASTNSAMMMLTLGVTDKVVGASYSSLDSVLFGSNLADKNKTVQIGTSSMAISLEDSTANGAAAVIKNKNVNGLITDWNRSYINSAYTKNTSDPADFEKLGVSVIHVAAASTDTYVANSSYLLVGFFMQAEEKAQNFTEFYAETMEMLSKLAADIPEENKISAIASSTTGSVSSANSDYSQIIELAGGKYGLSGYDFGGSSSVKIAQNLNIYAYDFTYIVHLRTALGFAPMTDDKVASTWSEYTSPFAIWSDSSSNNKQIMVSGTVPIPFRVAYTMAMFYPDVLAVSTVDGLLEKYMSEYLGLETKADALTLAYSADVAVPVDDEINYAKAVLLVYGNANGDDRLDNLDISIIQDIIDKKKKLADYPYADANLDGKVDATDKTIVTKAIAGETTTLYVINQLTEEDYEQFVKDGVSRAAYTVAKVTYPLTNTVVINSDMTTLHTQLGIAKYVAGHVASDYTNITSPEFKSQRLGTDARTLSEASYKALVDLYAGLRKDDQTVGALICYNANALKAYEKDLTKMGIPIILSKVTMAKQSMSAAVTLSFLYGKDSAEIGQNYAQDSLDVYNYVAEKVGSVAEADRIKTLSVCMDYYIGQAGSQYVEAVELAGGINQGTKAGTSSDKLTTTEAAANYQNSVIISYTTKGFTKMSGEDVVKLFENKGNAQKFLSSNPAYPDSIYYINSSMPVPCRVAYIAEILYPELFAGYGDATLQKFVDKYCDYLNNVMDDGDFDVKADMTAVMSFEDYVAAGGSVIKTKVSA